MAGRVISIEIGYSLTRVCEMDYKAKSPKIYNSFTIPTMEGIVNDGALVLKPQYIEDLRKAIIDHKIKAKQVVFSVSSAKIASREVTIPFVKENRIADVVKANAADYFPVDLSQYQLAYSILETIGTEKGNQQYKLLVLAAPSAMLDGYYELASALKLEVLGIEYVGNSLFHLVKNDCAEGVHLIVKMEERATLVMVVQNGKITFLRNVAYGVEEAIQTIQDSLVWGEAQDAIQALEIAEQNECIELRQWPQGSDEAATQKSPEDKAKADVTAALNPLIGGIVRVIDYYASRTADASIENVMITGLGANFRGMSALLEREVSRPVSVISKVSGLSLEKYFKKEFIGEYTTCIGAAMEPGGFKRETEKAKKGVGGEKSAKGSSAGPVIAFVCLGVGLFASLILIAISCLSYFSMAKINKDLKDKVTELSPVIEVYNNYTAKLSEYNQVTAMYQVTESRNDALYDFFLELEQKLPADVNVVSFTCDKEIIGITMKVSTKGEAAAAIEQLRTFKSLIPETVTVSSLTLEEDAENGISAVNFTVAAAYAPITQEEEE